MKQKLLAKYPKTPHLPGSGAVVKGDIVLEKEEAWNFLSARTVLVEEKLDGANVRIRYDGENDLLVGNREHLLLKGYVKKSTPAKLQFRPLWNFIYDRRERFKDLTKALGTAEFTIYAEWMYAEHTVKYNNLPEYLIPFAIKLDESPHLLDPAISRKLISEAGFATPPLLASYSECPPEVVSDGIKSLMEASSSAYSSANREGLYIKAGNGETTTHIVKYVHGDFSPVADFTERGMRTNVVGQALS
jgi:ATP-dependent RNA circularization protein (DNA/RNA ligase family)